MEKFGVSSLNVGNGECKASARIQGVRKIGANFSLDVSRLSCPNEFEANCALKGVIGATINTEVESESSTLSSVIPVIKQAIQEEIGCSRAIEE